MLALCMSEMAHIKGVLAREKPLCLTSPESAELARRLEWQWTSMRCEAEDVVQVVASDILEYELSHCQGDAVYYTGFAFYKGDALEGDAPRETSNVVRALVHIEERRIDEAHIRRVHAQVMDGLLTEPGRYRTSLVVAAGGGHYCLPAAIPARMAALVAWLEKELEEADAAEFPDTFLHTFYVCAGFFAEFLRIHPFRDGNGRTARVLLWHLTDRRLGVYFTPSGPGGWEEYLDMLRAFPADGSVVALQRYFMAAAISQGERAHRSGGWVDTDSIECDSD